MKRTPEARAACQKLMAESREAQQYSNVELKADETPIAWARRLRIASDNGNPVAARRLKWLEANSQYRAVLRNTTAPLSIIS